MAKLAEARVGRKRKDEFFLRFDELSEFLTPEEYFQFLETIIDSARSYLRKISNPSLRDEIKESYIAMIDYAIELKLKELENF